MNTQTFNWGEYGKHDGAIFIGGPGQCSSAKYVNVRAYRGGVMVGSYSNPLSAANALKLANSSVSKSILKGGEVSGYTFKADLLKQRY